MRYVNVYPVTGKNTLCESQWIDSKKRPIRKIVVEGKPVDLYVGPDAHGFITESSEGDYIMVGNEKRWWRGIIDPIPDDPRLNSLNEFGFCSIKPDAFKRGLDSAIKEELSLRGFVLMGEKTVQMRQSDIFRLYPYFFEPEWESVLVGYFTSGITQFMILHGESVTERLLEARKTIRGVYRNPQEHPVMNLFHCSDSNAEAIREALLFFNVEELIGCVGYLSEVQLK